MFDINEKFAFGNDMTICSLVVFVNTIDSLYLKTSKPCQWVGKAWWMMSKPPRPNQKNQRCSGDVYSHIFTGCRFERPVDSFLKNVTFFLWVAKWISVKKRRITVVFWSWRKGSSAGSFVIIMYPPSRWTRINCAWFLPKRRWGFSTSSNALLNNSTFRRQCCLSFTEATGLLLYGKGHRLLNYCSSKPILCFFPWFYGKQLPGVLLRLYPEAQKPAT